MIERFVEEIALFVSFSINISSINWDVFANVVRKFKSKIVVEMSIESANDKKSEKARDDEIVDINNHNDFSSCKSNNAWR